MMQRRENAVIYNRGERLQSSDMTGAGLDGA